MKKSIVACLTGCALVATVWIASPSQSNAQAGNGKGETGTWMAKIEIDGLPGVIIQQVSNVHLDGTYVTTDSGDFGLGGLFPGFDSATHGSWKREPGGGTLYRGVYQSFDENGLHDANVVSTAVIDLGTDQDTAVGTWVNEVYLPHQDPFGEAPVAVFTGSLTSQRMPMD